MHIQVNIPFFMFVHTTQKYTVLICIKGRHDRVPAARPGGETHNLPDYGNQVRGRSVFRQFSGKKTGAEPGRFFKISVEMRLQVRYNKDKEPETR